LVEELPSALSPATGVLVYSLRKNLEKAKLLVDVVLGSPKFQELGGLPLCEDVLH